MKNKAKTTSKMNFGALLYGKITSCLVHQTNIDEHVTSNSEINCMYNMPAYILPIKIFFFAFSISVGLSFSSTFSYKTNDFFSDFVLGSLIVRLYAFLILALTIKGSKSKQIM